MERIIGAGGGGGGGKGSSSSSSSSSPETTDDSLNSKQFVTVLDLISEGEIEGLKNGAKSIYINNTPLQNPDDSYNFKNVALRTRNGTQDQPYIQLAAAVENEIPVGVTVEQTTPIVRTITDQNTDAVRVTLSVPQLQRIEDDGDIRGDYFTYQIQVQYNGGGFTTVIDEEVRGRTADLYQRDHRINLDGAFPVDIKVVRTRADSNDPKKVNAFSWSSYTEIIYGKPRYPNSALVALRVSAAQFSSIPARSYLIRGIKVRIPNNATVDATTGRLIYSGTWTGTFGAAQWCSDPAWILWDLLTSTRYGFGDHILTDSEKASFNGNAANLDKWAFYSASQYCSTLVPDGFGGQEPRFSCNVNIQTAEDAYRLINDMCSVFRAMPYWSTGALTISQDRPTDSTCIFTLANVSEEGFSYSGSSSKVRPTVAVVSYMDLDLRDTAYEVVEDADGIAKYGVVKTEVAAFACTSRGQAQRLGEWLLYSERYESEVVSFTTSIDSGVIVRPGQFIRIADPVRAGERRGGRIFSATSTTITVDDATGLPESGGLVWVVLPDGRTENRVMTSRSGNVLTVASAYSAIPSQNAVWAHGSDQIGLTFWRVISVQEQDACQYVVNALAYNPSKYDYIERGVALQVRDTTNLNVLPPAPTNLVLTEALYEYQDQVRAKVIASWKPVLGVSQYLVSWRKDNGNWTSRIVDGPDHEILDITPGVFDFRINSQSPTFKPSTTALTGTISALGKTAPPSDVTNFNFTADKDIGVMLTWDAIPDIDADQYEIRRGASWGTATRVTKVKATTYKLGSLDDGTYTYLIKAIDTSGVYSVNAASISVSVAAPNPAIISSSIQGNDLVLSWTAPVVTTYAIAYYRVSYGDTFATSAEIAKTQSTTYTLPVTWTGSRKFWVVPVDLVGKVPASPDSEVVAVIGAAAPTITTSAGGNSAQLNWTAVAGTLPTVGYEIRQGSTFSAATVLASITGTAYSFRATWTGAQTFWVVAKDANGNYGAQASAVITINAAGAPNLNSSFAGQNVVFSWAPVAGTLDTDRYVLKRGSSWATATTVATIYSTVYTLKADWGGVQKFWLAAVDVNGVEGTPDDADVTVALPTAPTITQQVIDNNVLLRWNDVTQTLPIVSYELRRGSTWAGASVVGTKQGGFTTVFETASGTYTYWLAGIDSAGNYGAPGSVSAIVNQPPDYVLQLDQNSTFAGTKANIYADSTLGQIVNVNTTETWQDHFTSRGYTSPQDQIDAGFAYYLMPTTTTASYEEEADYGALLAGTKVSATLTSTNVVGSTTVTPTIRIRGTTSTAGTYSQSGTTITVTSTAHGLLAGDYVYLDFTSGTATDGTYVVATAAANSFTVTSATSATTSGNVSWVKWISYANSTEVFGTNFRYFRVRYDFASSGGNDLMLLTALNLRLDSKLRNDAGVGTANSGDTGGTTVNFNVPFVDVESITVTALSTTGVIAVYDFVDAPNPTSFKVLLFNTSGSRVSGSFSWTARGV
jgi:predicted phage tail protein